MIIIPADVTSLILRYNQITALQDCEFCQYIQLQILDLRDNQIKVISSSAFGNTTKLRILFLHYNQLRSVESSTFDGLTELQQLGLSHNKLTTLAAVPSERLKFINLSGNRMICDSRLQWLKDAEKSGVNVFNFTLCRSTLPSGEIIPQSLRRRTKSTW